MGVEDWSLRTQSRFFSVEDPKPKTEPERCSVPLELVPLVLVVFSTKGTLLSLLLGVGQSPKKDSLISVGLVCVCVPKRGESIKRQSKGNSPLSPLTGCFFCEMRHPALCHSVCKSQSQAM